MEKLLEKLIVSQPVKNFPILYGIPMFNTLITKAHQSTPWSKVLLEMLIVAQLVKKFPVFYGIPMFITLFTRARG